MGVPSEAGTARLAAPGRAGQADSPVQRRRALIDQPEAGPRGEDMHLPTFEEFAALAAGHTVVPVYRQLIGDTLTPVTAFCKIQEGEWAFLFESVVGGERLGRYSFLGSGPFLRFQAFGPRVLIEKTESGRLERMETQHSDPLRLLEEQLIRFRAPTLRGLPRFTGGAVGYAGYDSVRYVERLPNPPADDRGLPDLCFAFYDRMVIFDHLNKTVAAVAHAHVPNRKQGTGDSEQDLRKSYQSACTRVDRLVERLQQGVADLQLTDIVPVGEVQRPYHSNFEPVAFESAVAKCMEYIKAG